MLFENYEFYHSNNKLENIETGFNKGNMFKDEYINYKKFTPKKPSLKNNQEQELYEIMKLSFAINDLNLYLDLHPNDKNIFNTFNEIKKELKQKTKEYTNKYNSLSLTSDNDKYDWTTTFPWESQSDSSYV